MIKFEFDTTILQKAFKTLKPQVFDLAIKEATREIAREAHKALLTNTPVVTGELLAGWNTGENLAFTAKKVDGGYEVTLTNKVSYASPVNYGHPAKNQYGGPYVVHDRIKVPVAHSLQNPADDTWVWGHFFVEESELQTEPKCYDIVQKNLRKYFMRWLSGK